MDKLEKKVEDKKQKKKKTFWERMFKKEKLKKPNKVAVIYLKTNSIAKPEILETTNGFFNYNGRTYHEDRDCIYNIQVDKERYPFCIIPEWSVTPLGRKSWEDKDMQEKFAILQDHVMKGIRHAERVRGGEKENTKLNGKMIITIVIAAIIFISFLASYIK